MLMNVFVDAVIVFSMIYDQMFFVLDKMFFVITAGKK